MAMKAESVRDITERKVEAKEKTQRKLNPVTLESLGKAKSKNTTIEAVNTVLAQAFDINYS